MRWRVIAIVAAAGLAALPPARAQDSTPHQAEYLKIYLKINDADQLKQKGDYRGALADFKDCYTRLLKIHNSDPNWESALVIHRMADCKKMILSLADLAAQQPPSPPSATVEQPEGDANLPPIDSAAEIASLKQQLGEVKQQLADAQEKLQNSQIESTNLRTQLDAVNQELAALKGGQTEDERMGRLLSENKALTDKLAAAQKQIALIKPDNPKSALSLARVQLKNTEDKLAASEAANTALQQTTSTLQSQLEQAQDDLRDANQRLAASPPSSPEYATLKRENEVMRDILTREVQEQAHRDMAKRLMQEEFDRLRITSAVLREQLDILGSPMTPPTSDEERMLLDSLRTPPAQVMPAEGNTFAAPSTPSTNTPPAADTNVATNPMVPSENPAANTAADTNAAPPTTNAAPAEMAATTNTPAGSDTNAPPVTVVTPPAADTNAAPINTNTVAETPIPPSSNSSTNTNTASSPAAPDTNAPAATTNLAASTPDTNAAPAQNPPPPTGATTYQDTVIHNGGNTNAPSAGSSEYSSKPRLPEDMRDTAQQAADLFKMQRYDEAADKYQSIIEKYPDSLYAWSNLGVVRFQQNKLPEALKALQQAVKLSPTDAFSYSNLGIVYYQMGQYPEAIAALERALALDPNNAMSHNYLGCACSQKGWTEVAEKQFTQAIALNDNFGDAHFNLALIYATEKPPSLELARLHYRRALELGIQPDPRLEKLLRMNGAGDSQATDAK